MLAHAAAAGPAQSMQGGLGGVGGGWGGLGGVGGVGLVGCRRQGDPPQHRFAAAPSDRGGGGWRKGWVSGKETDPGLLVPDASRQEAEANVNLLHVRDEL